MTSPNSKRSQRATSNLAIKLSNLKFSRLCVTMVTTERCSSQRRSWRKNRHPETQDPPRAGERIFSERKPILTRGGSNTDCSEHCSEHCGEHEFGSSSEDHSETLSKP